MFRYYNAAANVETPHRPSTINQHVHALSFDFRLSVHTASFCCANCVSHMVRVFIVGLPFCGILLQLLAQIPPDPLCVFVLPIAMPLFTVLLLHCGFEEWLPTANLPPAAGHSFLGFLAAHNSSVVAFLEPLVQFSCGCLCACALARRFLPRASRPSCWDTVGGAFRSCNLPKRCV